MFSVLFRSYLHFKTTGTFGLAGDEKNRPKRHVWRCLSLLYVFFCHNFYFTNNIFSFYLITTAWKLRDDKNDKHSDVIEYLE